MLHTQFSEKHLNVMMKSGWNLTALEDKIWPPEDEIWPSED